MVTWSQGKFILVNGSLVSLMKCWGIPDAGMKIHPKEELFNPKMLNKYLLQDQIRIPKKSQQVQGLVLPGQRIMWYPLHQSQTEKLISISTWMGMMTMLRLVLITRRTVPLSGVLAVIKNGGDVSVVLSLHNCNSVVVAGFV